MARFIKGMTLKQAKAWLEDVVKLKRPIPIKTFKKKQAHHATPWEGWPVAKWPVKVAKRYLQLLENLENNAKFKGLDVERLVIIHAAAHKGIKIPNIMFIAAISSSGCTTATPNLGPHSASQCKMGLAGVMFALEAAVAAEGAFDEDNLKLAEALRAGRYKEEEKALAVKVAEKLVAKIPTMIAYHYRFSRGLELVRPRHDIT